MLAELIISCTALGATVLVSIQTLCNAMDISKVEKRVNNARKRRDDWLKRRNVRESSITSTSSGISSSDLESLNGNTEREYGEEGYMEEKGCQGLSSSDLKKIYSRSRIYLLH